MDEAISNNNNVTNTQEAIEPVMSDLFGMKEGKHPFAYLKESYIKHMPNKPQKHAIYYKDKGAKPFDIHKCKTVRAAIKATIAIDSFMVKRICEYIDRHTELPDIKGCTLCNIPIPIPVYDTHDNDCFWVYPSWFIAYYHASNAHKPNYIVNGRGGNMKQIRSACGSCWCVNPNHLWWVKVKEGQKDIYQARLNSLGIIKTREHTPKEIYIDIEGLTVCAADNVYDPSDEDPEPATKPEPEHRTRSTYSRTAKPTNLVDPCKRPFNESEYNSNEDMLRKAAGIRAKRKPTTKPNNQEVEGEPDSQEMEDEPDSQEMEDEPDSQEVEDEPDSQEAEGEPDSQEVENEPEAEIEEQEDPPALEEIPNRQRVKSEPRTEVEERRVTTKVPKLE